MSCITEEEPADVTAPVLAGCPENADLGVITDIDAAIAEFVSALTVTDDSGEPLTIVSDQELSSITEDGLFTITYTASDAAGNESNSCVFTGTLDTTPPLLVGCPANTDLGIVNDINVAIMTALDGNELTATDTVDESSTVTPDVDPSSITADSDFTITYTTRDTVGNVSSENCVFTGTLDTTAPVLICSEDTETIYVNAANVGAGTPEERIMAVMAAAADVEVTDANPATPAVVPVTPIDEISGIDSDGTFTVSYRAIADLAGNPSSSEDCNFTVVVDTIVPVLMNCPSDGNHDLSIVNDIDVAIMAELSGTPLTAMDGSLTIEASMILPNMEPSTITTEGAFTIIYSVSDAASNESNTCIFTGILDTIGPTLICSGNVDTIYVNAAHVGDDDSRANRVMAVTAAAADIMVTDANPATPSVVPVTQVNQISGIDSDGTFTVSYNAAADLAGNPPSSEDCDFMVTVDLIAPVLTCSGNEDIIYVNAEDVRRTNRITAVMNQATSVMENAVVIEENPATPPLELVTPIDDISGIDSDGTFLIFYRAAADLAGNQSDNICSFIVTVDTIPPMLNCPPRTNIIYINADDIDGANTDEARLAAVTAVVDDFGLMTDANLDTPSVQLFAPLSMPLITSGGVDGEYMNSVAYEATADLAKNFQNAVICPELSIVIDTIAPDISCAGTTNLGPTNNIEDAISTMNIFLTTTDTSAEVISEPENLDTLENGDFEITYVARDVAGNVSGTCTFTGTLNVTRPEFTEGTCPDQAERDTSFNTPMAVLDQIASITNNPPTWSEGDVMRVSDPETLPTTEESVIQGIIRITYSITNALGTRSSCIFRVAYDLIPPFIGLMNSFNVPCNPGNLVKATTSGPDSTTVRFSTVKFSLNTLVDIFPLAVEDNISYSSIIVGLSIQPFSSDPPMMITNLAEFNDDPNLDFDLSVGGYRVTTTGKDSAGNSASDFCIFAMEISLGE